MSNEKEQWIKAMLRFRQLCPPVAIRSKTGKFGKFPPLDKLLERVTPHLTTCGLLLYWPGSTGSDGARVETTAAIAHVGGHVEYSSVDLPVDPRWPDKGANPMQRFGISQTYGQRYSAYKALGFAAADDDDGFSAYDPPEENPTTTTPPPPDADAALPQPSAQRQGAPSQAREMIEKWKSVGIIQEDLETKLGKGAAEWTEDDLAKLQILGKSLAQVPATDRAGWLSRTFELPTSAVEG